MLVSVAVAGTALLPEGRWARTIRELLASALFLQNWPLAAADRLRRAGAAGRRGGRRRGGHLTASYTTSMAGLLQSQVEDALCAG